MLPSSGDDKAKILQIFAAIRRREEAGMDELYSRYGGALYHQILKIVPQEPEAKELLQDVFVRIWEKIDTYNEKAGRPYTWMARIARNRAIDYLRSAASNRQAKTDSLPDTVNNSGRLAEELYTDHIGLQKVLSGLDQESQLVIDYLYFRGYTQAEAAKALKLPLGTLKTRSRRAIQLLRKRLGSDLLNITLPILTFFSQLI